jgi:hypothetical protein
MDIAYLRALNARHEAEKEPEVTVTPSGETVSTRPLTPALFDALFGGVNDNRNRRSV